MSNLLEKWYVWDGDTERDMSFRKYVKAIMYGDGLVVDREDLESTIDGARFFWQIGNNKRVTIVAYTLGEPVESKRGVTLKPVWRMNTGVKPEDKTGDVIFHGEDEIFDNSVWEWSIKDGGNYDIYAYQTTRTKPAKYRGKK